MTIDPDRLTDLAWCQFWQVSLVAIAVGLVTGVFCRRRTHLAHALWLLVVIKCLVPPVWSSPTSVFSWATIERTASSVVSSAPSTASGALRTVSAAAEPSAVSTASAAEASLPVGATNRSALPEPAGPSVLAWLGLVWAVGAAVYLIVTTAAGLAWLWRLRRSRVEIDGRLALFVADLSRRLGVRRDVRIRLTSQPIGPAVYGVFRPTLVLPAALVSEPSDASLEPILAHELIHARRGDGLACLLQWVAQALWWFHPLVWWVNRQLSRQRERCCDEEVIATLDCKPADYAKSLLDLLKLRSSLRPHFAFPGARPMEVTMKRLENIMDKTRRFSARAPRWCWVALAVGLWVVLPGAALENNDTSTVATATDEEPSKPESEPAATPPDKPAETAAGPSPDPLKKSTPEPSPPTREGRPAKDPAPMIKPVLKTPDRLAPVTGPIGPFDLLHIRALGTLLDQPIDGFYLVEPNGQVTLGPAYGRVELSGTTLKEANERVEKQLHTVLRNPFVKVKRKGRVTLWSKAIMPTAPYRIGSGDELRIHVLGALIDQPINGDYEVERDGSVYLFPYGDAVIERQTFDEAEKTISKVLSKTLRQPKVAVTQAQWKITPWPLPTAPHRIAPGDLLRIDVMGTFLGAPINGTFVVEPSGTVQLGPAYGRTGIGGLTVVDAEKGIQKHLERIVARPMVSVTLAGWRISPENP